MEDFLIKRQNKYKAYTFSNLTSLESIPTYFPAWLSGFIEAEGNFSLVFNNKGQLRKSAFTIGQLNDKAILLLIQSYFQGTTAIYTDKKANKDGLFYYRLHLYNAEVRSRLFNHLDTYPLLGNKLIQYTEFRDYYKNN
jgi:hypothetical protein